MLNLSSDNRDTIFLDIDGTLVKHNYDPEGSDDVFLYTTLKYLKENEDKYLVLTTSRDWENTKKVAETLHSMKIRVDLIVYGLPTGTRILVNDHKEGDPDKALAINTIRNEGVK